MRNSHVSATLKKLVVLVLVVFTDCCDLEQYFTEKQVSVEESAATSLIIFRGLTIASPPLHGGGVFTAYFDLINTYKGAETLNVWSANNYRYVCCMPEISF